MQKRKREKGGKARRKRAAVQGAACCVAGNACAFRIAWRRVHAAAEQAPLLWPHKKGGGGPKRVLTYLLLHDPTPSSDQAKEAARAETSRRCRSERERRGEKARQMRAGMQGEAGDWRARCVYLVF